MILLGFAKWSVFKAAKIKIAMFSLVFVAQIGEGLQIMKLYASFYLSIR